LAARARERALSLRARSRHPRHLSSGTPGTLGDRVLDAAGALQPPTLRSLDAIHLASAQQLEGELKALVTYDERMIAAARSAGFRVVQPS
jgi:hypothetical protein